MTEKNAVVFGAGKIARGFIAHLLTLSGYRITFVEKLPALVELMRERREYRVSIMGAPEKDIVIRGFTVLHASEAERVTEAVVNASVVFVSIGGPNLPQIAPLLAVGHPPPRFKTEHHPGRELLPAGRLASHADFGKPHAAA